MTDQTPKHSFFVDAAKAITPALAVAGTIALALLLGADLAELSGTTASVVAGILALSSLLWQGYEWSSVREYHRQHDALLRRMRRAWGEAERRGPDSPVKPAPLVKGVRAGTANQRYIKAELRALRWFPFVCAGSVLFLGVLKLAVWAQAATLFALVWMASYLTRAVATSQEMADNMDELETEERKMSEIEARLGLPLVEDR